MTAAPVIHMLGTEMVSTLADHWRGEDFSLDAFSGYTQGAGRKRAATFSRTGTAAPLDVNGNSRTVRDYCPAWDMTDFDGDSVRETPALFLGANDKISWGFLAPPKALTLYIEFVENGTIAIASAAVVYIGNAGNSGARFWIDSTGTYYRVRHDNGTTAVTSTLAAAPTTGQRVALRATLGSDGKVQIHQSINGAAETSGALSAANTLASSWSGTSLYMGTTGDTNPGNNKYVRRRIAWGSKTAAEMQVAW